MFIHFIKGIQVAIIAPLATLFAHNCFYYTFRLLRNNTNVLPDKFHETFVIFGALIAADDSLF